MTETYAEEAAANIGEEREAVEYENQREDGIEKNVPTDEINKALKELLLEMKSLRSQMEHVVDILADITDPL